MLPSIKLGWLQLTPYISPIQPLLVCIYVAYCGWKNLRHRVLNQEPEHHSDQRSCRSYSLLAQAELNRMQVEPQRPKDLSQLSAIESAPLWWDTLYSQDLFTKIQKIFQHQVQLVHVHQETNCYTFPPFVVDRLLR